MKKTVIFFLLSFVMLAGVAQQKAFDMSQVYPIETSHSYLGFSVEYMGYAKVRGRFADFQGTFVYDEDNISNTSVSFLADVASIDTDLDWRDKDLKSANWFDVEKFPNIYFVSNGVKPLKEGFEITGKLTIKGVAREVTLLMNNPSGVLTDTRGDSQVIFTGELTINRKDYGVAGENWSRVKEGLTAVGDNVKIEVSMLGKQINKGNFKNWVRNEKRPPGMVYKMVNEKGVELTLKEFDKIRSAPDSKINTGALNIAGYMLLKEGRNEEALQLLAANVKAFPEDANVYDSYAEALAKSGRFKEAIKYYQVSLKKNPDNQNALELLRHL